MLKSATLAADASHTSGSLVGVLDNNTETITENKPGATTGTNRTGRQTGGGSLERPAPSYRFDSLTDFVPGSASPEGRANPAFPGTTNPADFGGNCRRGIETLSAYLDGELDSDSQAEVANHLNNCPQCADAFDALLATDRMIQREWRDAPLPSASEMRFALDSIMDALPPLPVAPPAFAPRRIHAKARWMRFATGIAGVIALLGLLWSSYRLGFAQGRSSLSSQFAPRPQSGMKHLKSLLKSAAIPNANYGNAKFVGSAPCLSGWFPRSESLQFAR